MSLLSVGNLINQVAEMTKDKYTSTELENRFRGHHESMMDHSYDDRERRGGGGV